MDDSEDIIYRLRKRAAIRRSIPRGEPDRISDILEEAADEIRELRIDRDMYENLYFELKYRWK